MRVQWFPVVNSIFTFASIITTYSIAVSKGHVKALFPTISDTGRYWPESRIFAVTINISAGLGFGIIFIKYLHYKQLFRWCSEKKANMLNIFALVIGCAAVLSQVLLANYKVGGSKEMK